MIQRNAASRWKPGKPLRTWVPDSVRASGIRQYVAYQAKEFEQLVKNGFCEDSGMHFEEYAYRWLDRQSWPLIARRWRCYTPTLAPSLSAACDPSIWRICWQSCGSKPIQEATAQKYLTVASAVLQRRQAKRDLGKEPCPHSAASDSAVHPARPDPGRGAEAPRRPGERVPALPAVLSPAHLIHRLPARRTVRPAMGRH